eukprot:2606978-Prymnesium_polylepis.1
MYGTTTWPFCSQRTRRTRARRLAHGADEIGNGRTTGAPDSRISTVDTSACQFSALWVRRGVFSDYMDVRELKCARPGSRHESRVR